MGAIQQVVASFGNSSSAWNPSDKSANISLATNNTIASNTSTSAGGVRGTSSHGSGKYYFEVVFGTVSSQMMFGVADGSHTLSNRPGIDDALGGSCRDDGLISVNSFGTFFSTGSSFIATSVGGVAVDVGAHKIYWARNNTWLHSADPAAGTNGLDYVTTSAVFPSVTFSGSTSGSSFTLITSSGSFNYSPPSGFSAWS